MKIKTNELTGAALDWAVAKCEDILHPWGYIRVQDGRVIWITPGNHEKADAWHQYRPSTDWAQGGPIIERGKIDVFWQDHQHAWVGSMSRGTNKIGFRHLQYGHTPLIAAMRCYVASKLGDEVEVPDELH